MEDEGHLNIAKGRKYSALISGGFYHEVEQVSPIQ
jgi:hypothetical protein